jgi:hypothetical protein
MTNKIQCPKDMVRMVATLNNLENAIKSAHNFFLLHPGSLRYVTNYEYPGLFEGMDYSMNIEPALERIQPEDRRGVRRLIRDFENES